MPTTTVALHDLVGNPVNFPNCTSCGKSFKDYEAAHNNQTATICYHCANDYFRCNMCSYFLPKKEHKEMNQYGYCNPCGAYRYSSCARCKRTFAKTETYMSYEGEIHCLICREQHNINLFQESSSFQLTYGIKRHWGVEIECNRPPGFKNQYPVSPGFQASQDGSLDRSVGEEHKSLIFCGDAGVSALKNHLALLNLKNYDINQKCGLHVHVDVTKNALEHEKIINLLSFISCWDRLLFSLLPEPRRQNKHCRPFRNFVSKENIKYIRNSGNPKLWIRLLSQTESTPDYRYAGFNIHAYKRHGTFEFRYHQGSLDFENIYYWTLLCLFIVENGSSKYWTGRIYSPTKGHLKKMFDFLKLPEPIAAYWRKKQAQFNPPAPIPFMAPPQTEPRPAIALSEDLYARWVAETAHQARLSSQRSLSDQDILELIANERRV